MLVVGLGVTFVGYSLAYYGMTQIQGGNWGLLDLVVPTRWPKAQNTPKDDGSTLGGKGKSPASSSSGFSLGGIGEGLGELPLNPLGGVKKILGNL